MAVRASRAAQIFGAALPAATLFGLTLSPAFAQQSADAPSAPALSRACEAPASDIAAPAPLPHTVAKLQQRGRLKVLAIGSSSTVWVGASSPSKSYPAQLEEILERAFKGMDIVIVNRGVSGELAATTSERLKTQVALESPDIVLWQVGTNDALAHVPVDTFAQTVRQTIGWLKEHNVDVLRVGLQYTF